MNILLNRRHCDFVLLPLRALSMEIHTR